jgi:hypothetical protein
VSQYSFFRPLASAFLALPDLPIGAILSPLVPGELAEIQREIGQQRPAARTKLDVCQIHFAGVTPI